MRQERPPRLRLIRMFLSLLVGFMGGLVGWIVVVMMAGLLPGATSAARPPLLYIFAFAAPGIATGYWFYAKLGSPR
jgi:hypothetical protein